MQKSRRKASDAANEPADKTGPRKRQDVIAHDDPRLVGRVNLDKTSRAIGTESVKDPATNPPAAEMVAKTEPGHPEANELHPIPNATTRTVPHTD